MSNDDNSPTRMTAATSGGNGSFPKPTSTQRPMLARFCGPAERVVAG
jgi:hypothetical protein